jgi:hypothetical protein
MKKYKLIIALAAALIFAAAIVLTISAQTRNGICVEDGSCCSDPDACNCD